MNLPPLSKAALRRYAALHHKKHRDSDKLFLAEGLRTVRELCQQLPHEDFLVALLLRPHAEAEALTFAQPYAHKLFSITAKECAQLADTTTPSGIFAIFRQPTFQPTIVNPQRRSLVVALDDVQDPGNVGTIMRTAAWFGVDALLCSQGTADLYNPKVVRSCAGSLFALPHYRCNAMAHELSHWQQQGYSIVCSSLEGRDICGGEAFGEKTVIVIGNEANGVSQGVQASADMLVRIPHAGSKPAVESLNASIAAAILIERCVLC